MTTMPGAFGRYQLLGTLGSGSFATVYRAKDSVLGREIALKALFPHLAQEAEYRQRFLAEAQALATLHHPNIVSVYDIGESDGRPFFAMELIEGQTLSSILAQGRGLPVERVIGIISKLGSALDHVHQAGFVHRDIKDANVIITGLDRVMLMDFGIALMSNRARLTQLGYGLGTAENAAPEQIQGLSVGPATDIYGLGILTYQLLAGRLPFVGDPAHILYAQANLPPPPLKELRLGLAEGIYTAVDAALAKDPLQRPASAGTFAALLVEAAKSAAEPSHARGDTLPHYVPTANVPAPQSKPSAPNSIANTTPAVSPASKGRVVTFPMPRPSEPIPYGRWKLFGARLAAALMDSVVGFIAFAVLVTTGAALGLRDIGGWIGIALWFAYYWWGNSRGDSLGRHAMGIRVVSEYTGRSIGWKAGLGRTLGYFVSLSVIFLGFLWSLWDSHWQAWHDKFVHSVVISI